MRLCKMTCGQTESPPPARIEQVSQTTSWEDSREGTAFVELKDYPGAYEVFYPL